MCHLWLQQHSLCFRNCCFLCLHGHEGDETNRGREILLQRPFIEGGIKKKYQGSTEVKIRHKYHPDSTWCATTSPNPCCSGLREFPPSWLQQFFTRAARLKSENTVWGAFSLRSWIAPNGGEKMQKLPFMDIQQSYNHYRMTIYMNEASE